MSLQILDPSSRTEQALRAARVQIPGCASFSGGRAAALVAPLEPSEWRWLAGFAFLVAGLLQIPYLIGYAQAAAGRDFMGAFWAPHDLAQFLAAMRDGAVSGGWAIRTHLSAEPHPAVVMYLPYVALGKAASALGASLRAAYVAAEIVARLTLVASIYLFAGTVLPRVAERRVAVALAVSCAGMSATLALFAVLTGLDLIPERYEFRNPEFNTLLTLFSYPHLMIGLALLLLVARAYVQSWREHRAQHTFVAGLASLGLGMANSFSLVTLLAVVGAHLALALIERRAIPRAALGTALAVFAGSAPFMIYNAVIFGHDPFWSATYGGQNVMLTPGPIALVLSLGPLSLLAALRLAAIARDRSVESRFLLVWLLVALLLMYTPVNVQRRFGFGLHPLLAIAATPLVIRCWEWVRRQRSAATRASLTFGMAQMLVGSAVSYYLMIGWVATDPVQGSASAQQGAAEVERGPFQPRAVQEAGRWLATAMGAEDVLLAEPGTANYLAGLVPGRVFVGHPVATLDFGAKVERTRSFFAGEGTAEERRRFLKEAGIGFVVYGPYERLADRGGAVLALGLDAAYDNGEVRVFEVPRNVGEGGR